MLSDIKSDEVVARLYQLIVPQLHLILRHGIYTSELAKF